MYRVWSLLRLLLTVLGPGLLYYWIRKRRGWPRLKAAAPSMGFTHQVTESYDDFGELHGERNGRAIRIRIAYDNPSFGPWISVALRSCPIADLKTYRPMTRPTEDEEEFDAPVRAFNRMYRTRRAVKGHGQRLQEQRELFQAVVDFYARWRLQLSSDIGTNGLVIQRDELRCYMGPSVVSSLFPYISPETIERIVTDMLSLADLLDPAA